MQEYNQIQNEHLGIRVPTVLKDRLQRYADKEFVKSSVIIRRALINEIERLKKIYDEDVPKTWSV